MPDIVLYVAGGGLLVSAAAGLLRLLRGPGIIDRVAGLDVSLIAVMGLVVVDALRTGSLANLDLLLVVAIVGFTTTVAVSRYVELNAAPTGPNGPQPERSEP